MCLELLTKTTQHFGQNGVSSAEIRRQWPDYYRHTNLLDMNIMFFTWQRHIGQTARIGDKILLGDAHTYTLERNNLKRPEWDWRTTLNENKFLGNVNYNELPQKKIQ
jgi:hypothetical protein